MSGPAVSIGQLDALIGQVRNSPRALLNVAHTLLLRHGSTDRVMAAADQALAQAPDDPEVAAMATLLGSKLVDAWYFSMVQDETRHAHYAQALARVIEPGSVVLDIGSGTGLFAMLAARAGAALVVGCEQHRAVAAGAAAVVAANGLSDRVRIVNKPLAALEVGVDLPRPADVILWDNLANNLLGAGCLPVLLNAKRRLARPDATLLPERAEVRVALVEDLRPLERAMDHAAGFDLTAFNRFRKSGVTIKRDQFALRSDPATIVTVDFTSDRPHLPQARETLVTASGGEVNGIVQWLRFHLADDITYDTSGTDVTAFGHQYHHIPQRIVAPGERVAIHGNGNGQDDWFWIG